MFYIKNLTQDLINEGEIDPDEAERMEDAWGDKMRSKDDFQIARNGITSSYHSNAIFASF